MFACGVKEGKGEPRGAIPGTLNVAEALRVREVLCDTLISDTSLDPSAPCSRKPDNSHTFSSRSAESHRPPATCPSPPPSAWILMLELKLLRQGQPGETCPGHVCSVFRACAFSVLLHLQQDHMCDPLVGTRTQGERRKREWWETPKTNCLFKSPVNLEESKI